MKKMTEGIVKIHGKEYMTVAFRVNKFRELHPDWTIKTKIVMQDGERVIMKASIYGPAEHRVIAAGTEHECSVSIDRVLLATGHAEEVRAATSINRTSALEVAETSAIGRALAALGMAGTEYASADEVAGAIMQQNAASAFSSKQMKTKVWTALKDAASNDDELKARETWDELTTEQQLEVWKDLSSGVRSTIKKLLDATKPEVAE
jgi:hypothetical protein